MHRPSNAFHLNIDYLLMPDLHILNLKLDKWENMIKINFRPCSFLADVFVCFSGRVNNRSVSREMSQTSVVTPLVLKLCRGVCAQAVRCKSPLGSDRQRRRDIYDRENVSEINPLNHFTTASVCYTLLQQCYG